RTFFSNRPICGCKFALRIIRASVERIALACTLLDQFTILALRTLHTDKILLHVLALRVSAARGELAEAPVPDHQIPAAFRAKLVERDIGDLLPLIEAARRLAVRISCASHELPEAPTLQYHHPAAVLAVLFLCSFLQVGRIKIGQVDGIFFRKFAGIGIILVVGAACVERSVLTPLDYCCGWQNTLMGG